MSNQNPPHIAVYLDHRTARLFGLTRSTATETRITTDPGRRGHVHHRAGTPGSGHRGADKSYLDKIADHLKTAEQILILGPGEAKFELDRYLKTHAPAIHDRIIGIEALDQRGSAAICAFARKLMRKSDLMAVPRGR